MQPALDYASKKVKPTPTPANLRAIRLLSALFIAVAGIGGIGVLWVFRDDPGGGWSGLGAMMFYVPVLLFTIGALIQINVSRCMRFREPWKTRLRAFAACLWPCIIGGVVASLCSAELPFRAAFAVSRAPMERVAVQLLTDPTSWKGERWIGVWEIDSASVEGPGVAFHIKNSGGDNTLRLMWSPVPPPTGRFHSRPMGGNWYLQNDYF